MDIGYKLSFRRGVTINSVTNVVPVLHRDDGSEWYEVCEPHMTDTVAILGKNNDDEEVVVIIKKNEDNVDLMSDILL